MRWLCIVTACMASLALLRIARAEVRILVAVGAETGIPGDVPLRYAASDATHLASALEELGGLSRSYLLTTGTSSGLQQTLEQVQKEVAAARATGERTLLVFYYSGHADIDFLHAFGTRMSWDKLRGMLRTIDADATLSLIDACSSGGAAAAKGAHPGEPFAVERESAVAKGTVWITSSRGDEASFESDELGGSFFTHYMVSAMRGSGDLNEDGRVTLSEMYEFAYSQTVGETSLRLRSVQHPTYGFDLAGEGEIVLTELRNSRTSLVLPREVQGIYFLSRRYGGYRSTLEIAKKAGTLVRLGVGAGAYLLYRRDPDRVWVASYNLREGEERVMGETDLTAHRYESVVGKGGAIALDGWQVYSGAGVVGPLLNGASLSATGQLGVIWHQEGLGIELTTAYNQFGLAAIENHVDSQALDLAALVLAMSERNRAVISIGAGVSGLWLKQASAEGHRTLSLVPGLVVEGNLTSPLAGPVGFWFAAAYTVRFMHLAADPGLSIAGSPRFTAGFAFALQ